MNKTNLKLSIILLTAILLAYMPHIYAGLTFQSGTGYKIVCSQWSEGVVLVGAQHNMSTPIFYEENDTDSEDSYWLFNEIEENIYTIQNASTGEYITYDGIRDTYRRYVSLTTSTDGTNSQWKVASCEGGFTITSVANESHRINIRTDNGHIVGTYSHTGTPSANEVCNFIDASGNKVEYRDVVYASGTYGIDDTGKYWENNNISSPVVYTTDTSNPVLYTIKNVRSKKYVGIDDSGNLTQNEDVGAEFYFVKTSSGIHIFNADGTRYVSGKRGSGSAYNDQIVALQGTPEENNETWSIGYYSSSNAGYTLNVENCTYNTTTRTYWNDFYETAVGMYSLDGGCTFVFASSDSRHIAMLESAGYDFSDMLQNTQLVSQYIDSLRINGKMPIYDKRNKTYLLPADVAYRNGDDYTASVNFNVTDEDCTLLIDDNAVASGDDYTFGNITKGRSYELSVSKDNAVAATTPLTFTFMPVVEITGTTFSTDVYNEGTMRVTDAAAEEEPELNIAAFRYRGATASSKQKKAYAVKLRDETGESIDRSFFGLRSDNNWILDAMAIDGARMRNRVSTDLWLDFSAKPYQSEYKPKAVNGTRGRFVEVVRNGVYAGIYCMTEKIDRKQLQLRKIIQQSELIPSDTVRGVLYKSTSWTYSIFMGHESDTKYYPGSSVASYNNSSASWNGWEIKYPDLDDGETIDWAPLYNATNLVASGSESDFKEQLEDYFDMPVWRDYYLFIELMLATDNHGKNAYLYNYDMRKFNKMGIAPWDLDGTWGMRWDGSETITADATQDFVTFLWNYEHGEHNLYRRLALYDYKDWSETLANRYAELRKNYFNPDSLVARFVAYRELFEDSGADTREYNRWNGSDGITLGFDDEMTYLDNWIHSRIATLDTQYGYDPTSGLKSVITDNFYARGGNGQITVRSDNGTKVKIYTTDGILVREVSVDSGVTVIDNLAKGIYLVNNRKVIVL